MSYWENHEAKPRTAGSARAPAARRKRHDPLKVIENAHEASALLKALSHETRLAILCLLIEGERTVSELERSLGMRQSAVSQQLARLRADELVVARRDGKQVLYSVGRPEAAEIVDSLYRAFCLR